MNLYAILMAGGAGTRFWPRSRRQSPKQVLNIVGKDTMIQATYKRLAGLVDDAQVKIVTTADQQPIIREQLPSLSEESFLIEPFGRNTAPCIGLAAIHVAVQDPEGIMLVLPADHIITKVDEFRDVTRLAARFAMENDALVTMGITPYEPATGYGYIQGGEEVHTSGPYQVLKVRTFAEKPNLETATRFLESGDFYWNSGMFVWKASTILQEMQENLPDIYEQLMKIYEQIGTRDYASILQEAYQQMSNISVDVGIMQQSDRVFVIPADMGWNDVGSWETVHDISGKDRYQHAGQFAELVNVNSRGCYVYSPDKAVALVGVENLIVVDTGDALLICDKSAAQDVKAVVDQLSKKGQNKWL